MSESVIIANPKGIIEYVNPAFERLTGYSHQEAIGQNPRILKSGQHANEFYRQMWERLSSGNVWEGQLNNKSKDGHVFSEQATISPVFDQEGVIIGACRQKGHYPANSVQ